MHDNRQPSSGLAFALPDHRIVALSGRDAASFAQAQFINDVKPLLPGQWQWSGWLTPKGRVMALFALLKLDEETVWLLLADADPVAFAAALRRFIFRAKAAVDVREDLHVEARFEAPGNARGSTFVRDAAGDIELDLGSAGRARTLRITPHATAPSLHEAADEWKLADLEYGLPRLPSSQLEQWTPQQLSLERLDGFSVKKGCYPGQEIVARTHFLGKAKRGLALYDADAPVCAGCAVHEGGVAWGTVVSSASVGGQHLALAVGGLERVPQEADCDDAHLRARPLLEGLAR